MASQKRTVTRADTTDGRRPKLILCLEDKVKILDRLRDGLSARAVGREFGVNESTVRSIRSREMEIRDALSRNSYYNARIGCVVRDVALEQMEKRLLGWINETLANGEDQLIGNCTIRNQALKFYAQITNDQPNAKPFFASTGWFNNFKRRNNLHKLLNLSSTENSSGGDSLNGVVDMPMSNEFDYQSLIPPPHSVVDDEAFGLLMKRIQAETAADRSSTAGGDGRTDSAQHQHHEKDSTTHQEHRPLETSASASVQAIPGTVMPIISEASSSNSDTSETINRILQAINMRTDPASFTSPNNVAGDFTAGASSSRLNSIATRRIQSFVVTLAEDLASFPLEKSLLFMRQIRKYMDERLLEYETGKSINSEAGVSIS